MVGVVIIGLVSWMVWKDKIPLNDPLGRNNGYVRNRGDYKVIGFLPTWMIGKTKDYTTELDELVFLGIEADENGDLIWELQSKKINNETYIGMKNKIRAAGGKNIVGIKLFDDEKLHTFLASDTARRNLIEQIKAVVVTGNFDGVNIDFEFMNDPNAVMGDENYRFMKELSEAEVGVISLDVFANTVIKGDVGELNRMLEVIDNLIVMAYDFHRPGSNNVGPVAPIKSEVGERNIMEVVTKVVDGGLNKKKVILAYPLYGYEWKTSVDEYGAKAVKGWSAMASYKRVKELIHDSQFTIQEVKTEDDEKIKLEDGVLKLRWDELSMSPWLSYFDGGEMMQIYFENLESLRLKFNLVAESQMGGVGFWALGYEGETNEVWKTVDEELK